MASPAVRQTIWENTTVRLRRFGPDMLWLAAAKAALIAGNALTFLFLARRIGTEHFGILATVAGAQILISRLSLFGTEQTMVRLRSAPEFVGREREVEGSALGVLLIAAATVAILGLSAGWLLEAVWNRTFAQKQIVMALAGGTGSALVDFAYWSWLARRKYHWAAVTHTALSIGRFLVLYVGLSSGLLPDDKVVLAFSFVTFAAGALQLFVLIGIQGCRLTLSLAPQMLRYSAYQAASVILGTVAIYQGMFLLTLLGRKADTGVYGFAVTATVGYMAVYAAASEFLMSRVGNVSTGAALRRFLRWSLAVAAGIVLICVPLTLAIAQVIGRIVPARLWGGGMTFYYLAAASLLTVLHAPVEVAAHWLLRPDWILANKTIRISAILAAGLLFADRGELGIARAQVLGVLAGWLPFAVLVVGQARKHGALDGPPRRAKGVTGPPLSGSGSVA